MIRLFDQGSTANKRLTVGLGLLVGVVCVLGISDLRIYMPTGIDFEIPLRAASRWASGGQVYPPSAMLVQSGPDLPFLYPPYVLPFLAPLAALPRDVVTGCWLALCLLGAAWTCRRLAIPWPAIPFVLAWPPFAEGLITGNVQIFSYAAFVALLYQPANGALEQRDLNSSTVAQNGILATAVGAAKVTQLLPVLYLFRRRPSAALIGAGALAIVFVATLPIIGPGLYGEWFAQLQRAADPAWTVGGVAVGRQLGIPDVVFAVAGMAMALTVRGRDSVAWLGIALLIATPSVHGYTFLFLLPGLLTIRRDVAISIAALFIGVYHTTAWWIAACLVVAVLIAMRRWPSLRAAQPRTGESDPASDRAAASDPT